MIDSAFMLELLDALREQGAIGQADPHPYSGRAMFGKYCIAISGEEISEWGVALALAYECQHRADINVALIPEPHTDSMGRGIVLYWPRFEWPADRPDPHIYAADDDDEDQPG